MSDITNIDELLAAEPTIVDLETNTTDRKAKLTRINNMATQKKKIEIDKTEVKEQPIEEKKESLDDIKKKLREKMRNKGRNANVKTRGSTKTPSYPLHMVNYCDAPGCLKHNQGKGLVCSSCKSFTYCSNECQLSDWNVKHKDMCGKNATPERKAIKALYIKAREATDLLTKKVEDGNYSTVLHEAGPGCIFTTIAAKSNVLNYKVYIDNPMFSTASMDSFGRMEPKVKAIQDSYPDMKIMTISMMLDRVMPDGEDTECYLRIFVTEDYGEVMDAPKLGDKTLARRRFIRKTVA